MTGWREIVSFSWPWRDSVASSKATHNVRVSKDCWVELISPLMYRWSCSSVVEYFDGKCVPSLW